MLLEVGWVDEAMQVVSINHSQEVRSKVKSGCSSRLK